MSGQNWDGLARQDVGRSEPLRSPYDRAPQGVTLAPAQVPNVGAAGTEPARRPMATWCAWAYCADDGGGSIIVYPGLSGGTPTLIVAGGIVWIGDGQISVGYDGTAPTRPVKFIGCTSSDALVLVTSKPNVPGGTSAPSAGTTTDTSLATANHGIPTDTRHPAAIGGTSAGSRPALVQVLPDTGGGGPNDPAAVVCFASSLADAGAGVGIYTTPGGDFQWGGGPLFGCELIADNVVALPETVIVVVTS